MNCEMCMGPKKRTQVCHCRTRVSVSERASKVPRPAYQLSRRNSNHTGPALAHHDASPNVSDLRSSDKNARSSTQD